MSAMVEGNAGAGTAANVPNTAAGVVQAQDSRAAEPEPMQSTRAPSLVIATPSHHIPRQQSWSGHGLHEAYTQDWGPIIHAVMGFNGKIERAAVEHALAPLKDFPRFVSRVSEDGSQWIPVSKLDMAERVSEVTLAGVNPQAELEALISDVLPLPFEPTGPLWEVLMVSYATASYATHLAPASESKANTETQPQQGGNDDGAGAGAGAGAGDGAGDGDGGGSPSPPPHNRFDLVFRISHSIGDGITLATLLIDLCEPLDASSTTNTVRKRRRRGQPLWLRAATVVLVLALLIAVPIVFDLATKDDIVGWVRGIIIAVWVLGVLMAWPPSRRFLIAAIKVGTLPTSRADTRTSMKGGYARRRRGDMAHEKLFASSTHRPIRVQSAKAVARWAATVAASTPPTCAPSPCHSPPAVPTINDVLLAALGGGVRRYLETRNDPAVRRHLRTRAISIVNMRAATGLAKSAKDLLEDVKSARWGNDFSYFIIPLLCDAMDHATRICRMNKVMRFIKASPEAVLIREFNKLLYKCIGVRGLMRFNQHNLDKLQCFMSNLAGPQFPLTFAGAKLERLYNCTHPMEFGAGYSFLSYNGVVTLCVASDAKLVPDPKVLVECIMQEYESYERAAGVSKPMPTGTATAPPTPTTESATRV